MKTTKILEQAFGLGASVLSPLVGGMMNESYIVEHNNKKYVLYISTKQANEMVDRRRERIDQKIFYELGITSKNVYFDEENGIKINEYIEGVSIDHVSDFNYQKIAKLMHTLHDSKRLCQEDYLPFDRFNEYESEANAFLPHQDEQFLKIRRALFSQKDYLSSQKKVICHNDAQRSNIIKTPNDEYFFIDFEFVGNNDPIYDIACFGNNSVQEGYQLLEAYFPHLTNDERERFFLWRMYISLQWYEVAIVKHYRGEGAIHNFNFLDVADHFLKNAEEAYQGYLTLK
ncbi:MAG: phosphotransferase [Bacilli bacterium]|nr:phosphotransferase [Bacilli bacterium]MDD3068825.1 phosphotransferase [Bacilli bacterium]MDD3841191.1 phosphotransferase [Bacilli bacterium]HKM10082.1 phosphotransferase [Bacilli bacterium]